MQNKVNKNVLVAGAAIIVIGLIIMLTSGKSKPSENLAPVMDQTATSSESVSTTTVKTMSTKSTTATTGSQPVSLSYQRALSLYTGNFRIQLSSGTICQASPSNVTYKNGTNIMIDNRSSQTRTVTIGTPYTIPGYGFKIVKISSSIVPVTILMDCNKQQNVATILIQK